MHEIVAEARRLVTCGQRVEALRYLADRLMNGLRGRLNASQEFAQLVEHLIHLVDEEGRQL